MSKCRTTIGDCSTLIGESLNNNPEWRSICVRSDLQLVRKVSLVGLRSASFISFSSQNATMLMIGYCYLMTVNSNSQTFPKASFPKRSIRNYKVNNQKVHHRTPPVGETV